MTPLSPVHVAVHANLAVIRQGIGLLAELGEARFTARIPICYNASVGGHLRHIVEHYQCFLRGLGEGGIDYEDRARDPLIEGSPGYASAIMEEISHRLTVLAATLPNRGLQIGAGTAEGLMTDTSVLRELEFLLSHTIHHYAIVAVMARVQGCEPEATFGVAPSTIKFQQTQNVCAR
ncbi:hypothetical protein [Horticoccus sp. 23ND18S-11]|uniref:hypothetical protein n=1 Tax=Horticoccus sp. 23ND18S-11 TaxID=3391832 RepID=UPI0039C96304